MSVMDFKEVEGELRWAPSVSKMICLGTVGEEGVVKISIRGLSIFVPPRSASIASTCSCAIWRLSSLYGTLPLLNRNSRVSPKPEGLGGRGSKDGVSSTWVALDLPTMLNNIFSLGKLFRNNCRAFLTLRMGPPDIDPDLYKHQEEVNICKGQILVNGMYLSTINMISQGSD